MPSSVEELASSLVREYLSRKGLKETLAKMDEELPRTVNSISNRSTLARSIYIEKLMKRNKESGCPLKTMIEVIVRYLLEKSRRVSSLSAVQSPHPSTTRGDVSLQADQRPYDDSVITGGEDDQPPNKRGRPPSLNGGENPPIRVEITPKNSSTVAISPGRAGAGRQRSLSLGEHSTTLNTSLKRGRGMEWKQHSFRPRNTVELEWDQKQAESIDEKPEGDMKMEKTPEDRRLSNFTGDLRPFDAGNHKSLRNSHSSDIKEMKETQELLCQDLEDFDLNEGDQLTATDCRAATKQLKKPSSQPIQLETAKMLRELLFGTAKGPSFNLEWRCQNFTFCELPGLEYGLVQDKGGPCGVLACVQAYLLKHLLFSSSRSGAGRLQPSSEERNMALISALSDILWKLGRQQKATVALPPSHPQHSARLPLRSYTPDHLTERVILYNFTDYSVLKDFITSHIFIFQREGQSGCIHFLLSALLSKGLDSIREDMDDENSSLIGTHNYCTQEMVNLLLTGHAVSNVFDGTVNLDSGAKQKHLLKGIFEQSEIGFLSLFEHYNTCIVGSHYKEPVFPVWVVCSESHFTVLFSLERNLLSDWQLEQKFDLLYYDGLASQDEEIRLTIDNIAGMTDVNTLQETSRQCFDLIPPLQLCIQTKWKNAVVDWNNTEPLL